MKFMITLSISLNWAYFTHSSIRFKGRIYSSINVLQFTQVTLTWDKMNTTWHTHMTHTYDISKPMILWYGKNKVATSAANGPTCSHFNRKRQAAYLILFKMYSRAMNEFFQREQLDTASLKCMYIFYTTVSEK